MHYWNHGVSHGSKFIACHPARYFKVLKFCIWWRNLCSRVIQEMKWPWREFGLHITSRVHGDNESSVSQEELFRLERVISGIFCYTVSRDQVGSHPSVLIYQFPRFPIIRSVFLERHYWTRSRNPCKRWLGRLIGGGSSRWRIHDYWIIYLI